MNYINGRPSGEATLDEKKTAHKEDTGRYAIFMTYEELAKLWDRKRKSGPDDYRNTIKSFNEHR